MQLNQLSQLNVAVWGFGVEGRASCEYLNFRCPDLKLTVLCPDNEVAEEVSAGMHSELVFNHQSIDHHFLSQFDVVIKSPGITPYQNAVNEANCEFISSTALWFSNERLNNPALIIAVTGTKGKSTSCAMLAEVLKAMDYEVQLVGNFGVPLIQCTEPCDFLVLETSSFQAQDGCIKADVAVLLNLFSEHLDWHGSEQQYHLDKWRLIKEAKQVILNAKDTNTHKLLVEDSLHNDKQLVNYFEDEQGFYELNAVLMYQDKALLSQHGWQLKGAHNLKNAASVCSVLMALDLDIKVGLNAIKQFKALPHRLETVAQIKGTTYINDSISSTPHATIAAMNTLEARRTILLLGGFDRGVDWQWWVEDIATDPPKMIICSGQNGENIHRLILNHKIKTQCIYEYSLEKAVAVAKQQAQSGDVVLLSPGAPSFDAFENYQHRGEQFIRWIN